MNQTPVLEVDGLAKAFAGVQALVSFSLVLEAGEIVGLVGANGSGKSTLVKTLAGYHRPDAGSIAVRGEALPNGYKPSAAQRAGMHFVHQDSPLFETLTVLENFALLGGNFVRTKSARIKWRATRRLAERALAEVPYSPPLTRLARDLTPAERAALSVAILTTSGGGEEAGLLVLDEATSALPLHDAEQILQLARDTADRRFGVIFISHRLEEVRSISDRVCVLRDGHLVAVVKQPLPPASELVAHMLGENTASPDEAPNARNATPSGDEGMQAHNSPRFVLRVKAKSGPPALEVTGLSGTRVRDVTFALRAGEILGVAGLLGCGRSELGRLVAGVQPITSGRVMTAGRIQRNLTIHKALEMGISYVPAYRLRDGLASDLTVGRNVVLRNDGHHLLAWTTQRAERRAASPLLRTFGVRPPDPERVVSTLSGGNQQKALLAKWLQMEPRILILDEATRGVDVGARAEIYSLLRRLAEEGLAVLLLSSDEEEIAMACDAALVLHEGRLVARLEGYELTEEEIVRAAYQ